jgi:hypothetical protein
VSRPTIDFGWWGHQPINATTFNNLQTIFNKFQPSTFNPSNNIQQPSTTFQVLIFTEKPHFTIYHLAISNKLPIFATDNEAERKGTNGSLLLL